MVKEKEPKTNNPEIEKDIVIRGEGHILKVMLKEKGVKTSKLLKRIRESDYGVDMPIPHLYRIFQDRVRIYKEEEMMLLECGELDPLEYYRRTRDFAKESCRLGRYSEKNKKC